MQSDIFAEPKIDCHVHVLDPARFPYGANTHYAPAGQEIGTAVIVYGGDNKQTPAGKLRILGKARDHKSSLYDAQMPFTLRLTDDGVSIHASSVRWGAATHGCIGVPPAFAERLFNATKVGDEVSVVGRPVPPRRS